MKRTPAERLARTMAAVLTRIHKYHKKITESTFQSGLCIASPKELGLKTPTHETLQQLQDQASAFFTANKADGFYFRYCPSLPFTCEDANPTSSTVDDYQLIFQFPSTNAKTEGELFARALLYCPGNDEEIGDCQIWFSPQEEAIRLAPLLHQSLKEKPVLVPKVEKKRYLAKRPTFCISDIECAQILYLLIHQFCTSPKKFQINGETALFIWIAQHAAFSSLNIKEKKILNLSTNDIDFEELVIRFGEREAYITDGLAALIAAWIGEDKNRPLFRKLNADNLEDAVGRISSKFLGASWKLQPKDLLIKVHVIPGARIPLEMREQLNAQEVLTKNSPYKVHISKIRKEILKACMKK